MSAVDYTASCRNSGKMAAAAVGAVSTVAYEMFAQHMSCKTMSNKTWIDTNVRPYG